MPKNTSPKVKALMATFTEQNAKKVNDKTIKSMRYVMKHWPSPCVSARSASYNSVTLPKLVGLTGGRHMTAKDVFDMTMRIITMGNPYRTDLQYSAQTFLKAIKPWIPSGILINADWANAKSRKTDELVLKVMDEFEEWVKDYCHSIEAELAGLYLNVGERSGAQYLKVLERRFRETWGTGSSTVAKANLTIGEKKEEEEQPKNTSVVFNFEVVTADNGLSDKS